MELVLLLSKMKAVRLAIFKYSLPQFYYQLRCYLIIFNKQYEYPAPERNDQIALFKSDVWSIISLSSSDQLYSIISLLVLQCMNIAIQPFRITLNM